MMSPRIVTHPRPWGPQSTFWHSAAFAHAQPRGEPSRWDKVCSSEALGRARRGASSIPEALKSALGMLGVYHRICGWPLLAHRPVLGDAINYADSVVSAFAPKAKVWP